MRFNQNLGFTRRIDELGRICLPMEMRRALGIKDRDPITLTMTSDGIFLAKATHSCAFCGAAEQLHEFRNNLICSDCLKELSAGNL